MRTFAIRRAEFVIPILFAVSVAVAAHTPQASAVTPGTPDEVTAFAVSLDACTPGAVATPHPLMKPFIVEHTITGQANDACAYAQTMPGKMRMECALSAAGRAAMAAEIRATANGGPMSGGTNRALPTWASECEIVTASGARSPMVQPARRPR